jgi:hypothetical protein
MSSVMLRNVDFSGLNAHDLSLRAAVIESSRLNHCEFRDIDLCRAIVRDTDISATVFRDASFHGAKLERCTVRQSIFGECDFSSASLAETLFQECRFAGGTMARTGFKKTVLASVELAEVREIEHAIHRAPSTVGIDTIFLSGGLPEGFLQGVGAPDIFISYASSFAGTSIYLLSCFISYSSFDESFARRLHGDLQARGVRCWFAPHDLEIGDRIRPTIERSIHLHDKLLLVLSKHSIESNWVESEVETAFERERLEQRDVLMPIRLDDAVFKSNAAWANHVRRTRHIGDFSVETVAPYAENLERLVRALRRRGIPGRMSSA